MAYYDEDPQTPPAAGGKAARAGMIALGLVLTAASAVSLIYLSQRWQEAAPYREARAIAAAKRQAEAEAARAAEEVERARSAKIGDPADPGAAPAVAATNGTAPPPRPTAPSGTPGPERQVDVGPVRWISEPRFRIPPEILAKTGPDRVAVRFECRVNRSGGLYGCTGTETPSGFGVLAAARAALAAARVEPMTYNGQPVEGVITFGHQWTRPPAIAVPEAGLRPAAPAASEPPAPAPEPAVEPAVAEGTSPPPQELLPGEG